MKPQQYLIECTDTTMCVVYEKSIIIGKKWKKLIVGDEVKFLYPEEEIEGQEQEEWEGKIIDVSSKITIIFTFTYSYMHLLFCL